MRPKLLPQEPTDNMINAAFMLIDTMKKGTEARDKAIVRAVYRAMWDVASISRTHGLTARQHQVHEIIADYITEHRISPLLDEIGAQLGIPKPNVWMHCHALRKKGVLIMSGTPRGIRLLVWPGEDIGKETGAAKIRTDLRKVKTPQAQSSRVGRAGREAGQPKRNTLHDHRGQFASHPKKT